MAASNGSSVAMVSRWRMASQCVTTAASAKRRHHQHKLVSWLKAAIRKWRNGEKRKRRQINVSAAS